MLFLTIVCILLTFVKSEIRLCSTPVGLVCKEFLPNIQEEVPANAWELGLFCLTTKDHIECLHRYDIACAGRSKFTGLEPPLNYNKIKKYLDDACDPNSNLHRLLGRELPCIHSRVIRSDEICATSNRDIMEAYKDYMEKYPIPEKQLKRLRRECLKKVATAACILEDIKKECGFLAYKASKNALATSQILAYKCDLDIFVQLQDVVPYLEIDDDKKENLRKLFVVNFY